MPKSISNARRKLLVRMESILGNACYNGNIQNYGPGGVREGEGRSFRYPMTVRMPDGAKCKVREMAIPASVPNEALLSGYYAFGANQLDVMAALDMILKHLEQNYGLVIPDQQ